MKIAKNTIRVTLKYSIFDVTMLTVNDDVKHITVETDDIKGYMRESHFVDIDGKQVLADCHRFKALGERKETYSVPLESYITWVKLNGEKVEKTAGEVEGFENE